MCHRQNLPKTTSTIRCPAQMKDSTKSGMNGFPRRARKSMCESMFSTSRQASSLKICNLDVGLRVDWRKELRTNHQSYAKQRKIIEEAGGDADEPVLVNLSEVESIHDADGSGTPLYGAFKYEDWMILAWCLELHLLVHAFVQDTGDTDCPGIPAKHLSHYYDLYFKRSYDPQAKLGRDDLPAVVKLLKWPLELHEHKGKAMLLRSTVEKDTPLEDLVKGVEKYR